MSQSFGGAFSLFQHMMLGLGLFSGRFLAMCFGWSLGPVVRVECLSSCFGGPVSGLGRRLCPAGGRLLFAAEFPRVQAGPGFLMGYSLECRIRCAQSGLVGGCFGPN